MDRNYKLTKNNAVLKPILIEISCCLLMIFKVKKKDFLTVFSGRKNDKKDVFLDVDIHFF